ncbi:MAG: indole-3-glycerol phosphate synthase TrpC [Synechococcales cyanobacterium RM1_1_8]|nr:indole-3-glycerol phosphate synthase TrpC [Synechococcales cyanobacterium RM1_1_8]
MQIRRRALNPVVRVADMSFKTSLSGDQPNNILEEIVWHKETEVNRMREKTPLAQLQAQMRSAPPPLDFLGRLQAQPTVPSVIAEVKKASPSKGVFREDFDPVAIAQSYARNNAACLSVLTDAEFFQGSFENLTLIRKAVDLPLLCKDFILYPYQITLARAHGADAILLIAAILSDQNLQYFLKITKLMGMTALIEVHTAAELERVLALEGVELIGINNRDLATFHTSLDVTCDLLQQYGSGQESRLGGITLVSESGMHSPQDLQRVAQAGATAVLVGESLIRQPDPGAALAALVAPSHPGGSGSSPKLDSPSA